MKNKGNSFINFIIIVGAIWFLISLFTGDDSGTRNQSSINSRPSKYCVEPVNPYSEGTGHYAGYEWGESGKSCGGRSDSFIEGCEEYELQEENYSNCINN